MVVLKKTALRVPFSHWPGRRTNAQKAWAFAAVSIRIQKEYRQLRPECEHAGALALDFELRQACAVYMPEL